MASTFRRPAKPKGPPSSSDAPSAASSSSNSLLGGTKPWAGGTTLTSSGLRDLDGILGGGQPLGTCMLLEEDRWTQTLALCLVRYWCAEAISQNQHLMIPTTTSSETSPPHYGVFDCDVFKLEENTHDDDDISHGASKAEMLQLLESLPRNLHWDKQQQKANNSTDTNTAVVADTDRAGHDSTQLLETLDEDADEEEGNEDTTDKSSAVAEEGLTIAWQYRTDVQRERLGHDAGGRSSSNARSSLADLFCHSYDLSSRMSEQTHPAQASVHPSYTLEPVSCCDAHSSSRQRPQQRRSCGFRLFRKVLLQLQTCVTEHPRQVIRLLLYHRNMETLAIALPLLLAQIRTQHWPVVVLVSLQSWTTPTSTATNNSSALTILHRTCDVVLQAEGFAARSTYPPPPEFRHLHGLLKIRKVATATAATALDGGHYADLTLSKRPPATLYGLKRDRRKLHIPLLHIPPEDHAEGGGGGVRSGAGRPSSTHSNKASTRSNSSTNLGCAAGTSSNSVLDF